MGHSELQTADRQPKHLYLDSYFEPETGQGGNSHLMEFFVGCGGFERKDILKDVKCLLKDRVWWTVREDSTCRDEAVGRAMERLWKK